MATALTEAETGLPADPGPGPAPSRRLLGPVGLFLFIGVLGFLVVLPLVRLQSAAFAGGGQGYRVAFGGAPAVKIIWTTVGLALGSLVVAMVLGTMLAWVATRMPPRYRMLRTLPILPIVIPAIANVIGWAFLLSPRPGYLNVLLRRLPWWSHLESGPVDVYSLPWIVIITGFGLTAFVYLFVSTGLQNIGQEHIEAARVAGSSPTEIFFRVVLPLLRPSLVYGGGVALLLGLGQFTAPLLLGTNSGTEVITTAMFRSVSESPVDYGAAAAYGSPLLLFGLAVVVVQKLALGDQSRFVTHGGKAFRSVGGTSKTAVAVMIGYTLVATVLPLAALCVVALSKFWSGTIGPSVLTLANFRTVLNEPRIVDAVVMSVGASIAAVAIVLPIGFVAACLLLRMRRFRWAHALLDYIVALPLGIPAVVFGAGFLLTYTSPPLILYGSRWVIILVYVTLMLPFATRMLMSGMIALGGGYVEASRVSGAGPVATDARIVLPLLRTSLGGAAALMFVLLTHEFSASMLVRAPTTQVMGTVLFDYWGNGSYPTVAAIALVMTIVTAGGVVAAMAAGGGTGVFEKL
ncbi:ABC transporter permease [Actinomadura sp. SCN-SB]|uniref:ABC transporter permease n=1 Tax=Actinomadura sp. SCN-SB TaxID=3373092 RepID=UPI0037500A31